MAVEKKDRKNTEKKIYEAFLEILQETGHHSVGVNAIAKRAGVSKQLIYRYFGGMRGLLLEYAKQGDFFNTLLLTSKDKEMDAEDLRKFLQTALTEVRENTLMQEILRWQLFESTEDTKDLFRYTNSKITEVFASGDKQLVRMPEFQLMIGGYIYFMLLSKFNKKFIALNLRENETWSIFDNAIMRMLDHAQSSE